MIQTENLTKVYKNGFKAVDSLNKGDIFGFPGPNGAGKTITIRMLDGLHVPMSETARIAGKNDMGIKKQYEKTVEWRIGMGVDPGILEFIQTYLRCDLVGSCSAVWETY